jgi:MoaA/NifB/PqqE/SkfB family radical SAM enzyme
MDISIVVPTYHRPQLLSKCLSSIIDQAYPKEKFEVIVVDDGSNKETKVIVEEFKNTTGTNLRYVAQDRKGPAAARNLGAKLASSPIIGFVDDDCILDNNWISRMVSEHRNSPSYVAVGGLTITEAQSTHVLISQFLSTCSITTSIDGKEEVIFFPTCNVSFKRDVFSRHKFNEKFPLPGGEDLEFFWRLFKDGYRFKWCKDIIVIHYRDKALRSFMRQAYIYGRGNFLVQYLHRDHPLLKELKTDRQFWIATFINTLKIPCFSYLMGRRFLRRNKSEEIDCKFKSYFYFCLHKVFYIIGNVVEFKRIKNIKQEKKVEFQIPNLLILDITHRCNLQCWMCDIWKDKERDIDKTYIEKIIMQAKKLGIKEIALSGGEPLLREDIFEIFEYAHNIGIKNLGVLTNGILVKKYFDKLRPYIEDNTITPVISFDSLKSEVHNYIRNSPFAWEKTLEALKKLSYLKSTNPLVNFEVITIILNGNLEELLDIAHFIHSLGTNSLQFQPLLPNNLKMAERKTSPFWITPDRLSLLDDKIDKLIYFKKKNPEFIKNSERNLLLVKKYYRGIINYKDVECNSAEKTILISNEGKFTTCFSAYGDIKKQSIEAVIQSKERERATEKVKKCRWPCLLPCFCDTSNM